MLWGNPLISLTRKLALLPSIIRKRFVILINIWSIQCTLIIVGGLVSDPYAHVVINSVLYRTHAVALYFRPLSFRMTAAVRGFSDMTT